MTKSAGRLAHGELPVNRPTYPDYRFNRCLLLAVSDLSSLTTLAASDLSTALTCSLCTHSTELQKHSFGKPAGTPISGPAANQQKKKGTDLEEAVRERATLASFDWTINAFHEA